jgi:integrase
VTIIERKGKKRTTYGVSVHDPKAGKTVWLGTFPTQREAERAERAATKVRPTTEVSFASFAQEWLTTRTHVEPTTLEHYTYALSHAIVYFGETPLKAITPRECEGYAAMLADDLKPLTARNIYDVFVRCMKAATRYHLIAENPATGATNLPKRKRSKSIAPLTLEEHAALIGAVPEFWRPLIGVWPMIGLRRGEMQGLRMEDVTPTHLLVREQIVRGEVREPKGGKCRDVPLVPEAQAWLDKQQHVPNREGRFFTTPQGSRLDVTWLWVNVMEDAFKAAGIPRRTPHDMRHTFASYLIHAGCNVKQIAAAMGHEDEAFTLRTYVHLMPRNDEEVRERLQHFLSTDDKGAG